MKINQLILPLTIGLSLACASIVVGKKTYFGHCTFSGRSTHVVDRGAPYAYFKVTPSESTCVPVDNVGAVFASDVGNDVNKNAFFAAWLIWTLLAGVGLAALHTKKSKQPVSAGQ